MLVSLEDCKGACPKTAGFRAISHSSYFCNCQYDDGTLPTETPDGFQPLQWYVGSGPVVLNSSPCSPLGGCRCYKYHPDP